MKKERIIKLAKLLLVPVLVTLAGLILLVNPDSATALASQLIGWVLVIIGAAKAISMADRRYYHTVGGWIWAAAAITLGIFILKNPLILAEALGRCLGLFLLIWGAQDLVRVLKSRRSGNAQPLPLILAIITLTAGIVLALLPLTLTRTIIRLCGIVALIVGIVNILEKLREVKLLEEGVDPNIIDADE